MPSLQDPVFKDSYRCKISQYFAWGQNMPKPCLEALPEQGLCLWCCFLQVSFRAGSCGVLALGIEVDLCKTGERCTGPPSTPKQTLHTTFCRGHCALVPLGGICSAEEFCSHPWTLQPGTSTAEIFYLFICLRLSFCESAGKERL